MPATKRSELNRLTACFVFFLFLAAGRGTTSVHAAPIHWKAVPYSHYAQKEELRDMLTDFFASQGIGVVCSQAVSGKISGNFVQKDPRGFFDQITDAYNLIWYYDGAAVYIYSAHEMTSRILNLGYLDLRKFRQNLIDLGILDAKFALRMVEKERVAYVSGPPRFVQLIADMAEQLDAKAMAQRGRDDIIQVFPLKYAWADDKTLLFRDRQMTIPGVATLLGNLITGTSAPGQVLQREPAAYTEALGKLKGRGLAATRRKPDLSTGENSTGEDQHPDSGDNDGSRPQRYPPAFIDTDTGFVQADIRQNAVVVRDREEKMPYYRRIINLLDTPVGLVEIRATIMDINRSDLENLGVQWEFRATGDDGEKVARGGLNTTGLFSQQEGLQLPIGDGLNLATIIGDTTDYFLAKVYALQEKGHAKILSRPSVLTLNNVEAQLEHSDTFYVRLTGEREVDLYDINAGVVLRVTPHIISEKDQTLVKLAIQIEDGELSGERVDDIPVVRKSVVNTQAVVGQKESLLIGGYMKERNISTRQTVPCLGEVPLLGWLFRKQSTLEDQSERLFLITPTIVPYGTGKHIAGQGGHVPAQSPSTLNHNTLESDSRPGLPGARTKAPTPPAAVAVPSRNRIEQTTTAESSGPPAPNVSKK